MKREEANTLYHDFLLSIFGSWTFQRMTEEEREKCLDALNWGASAGAVKGAKNARWLILQALYNAFLVGIGYDGPNWREAAS